ncbi:MAG: aminoglycoside phosphotransferase family protein [Verrucomicrobiales bacterium]|nr:aminoglycoside phosphotransferase family protein [Verrucomicrobiales bacterium]
MNRREIYYWKCDRPATFHGTDTARESAVSIEEPLSEALKHHFDTGAVVLSPGSGQGNHLTWQAVIDGVAMFLRVENGPEQDHHLAVESAILDRIRESGVRTPIVHGCDASRERVPFAWQALEMINEPDLNHWQKQNCLNAEAIAFEIGVGVATWQSVQFPGYGVPDENLRGYHAAYPGYFHLNLERHLDFLVERQFLDVAEKGEIVAVINEHAALLNLKSGCLVHKDLALWNIMGTPEKVTAFIDLDDAISGDPMDDLSLLACFHDAAFLARAFAGYETVRPLPDEHRRRFWLHLLRNMIVKAVIRVGAGYFDRDDQFFLIGSGGTGADLKAVTRQKMAVALKGLREDLELSHL